MEEQTEGREEGRREEGRREGGKEGGRKGGREGIVLKWCNCTRDDKGVWNDMESLRYVSIQEQSPVMMYTPSCVSVVEEVAGLDVPVDDVV